MLEFEMRARLNYTTATNTIVIEVPRHKQLYPWLVCPSRAPMTEVKRAVAGLTRASHHRSPNDMNRTKTLPSLAEVEERRLWNLRIFACEVAGV